MMTRKYTILYALLISSLANAQLPKWVINPSYDTIDFKIDGKIIETKSNGETQLWDLEGNQLYKTEYTILPYKDGLAPVVSKDKKIIHGYVDADGRFSPLPDLHVAYDNPYFEDGYILCKDGLVDAFYNKKGEQVKFHDAVTSYPFHHGYAPFFTYDQMEKKKDPYFGYNKANREPVRYKISVNGSVKDLDPRTIEFLSGINSENKGVGVIKGKLYWFDTLTETFEPMLWGEGDNEKKRHLALHGEYENYFSYLPYDTVCINAKFNKNLFANLKFDPELIPVKFTYDGTEKTFEEKPEERARYTSALTEFREYGKYGISLNDKKVIPAQFDKVGVKYGNKAFVMQNGKWGILNVIPDINYTLKLNKGEDIAFRHQKFETQLRLDLPQQISARDARIDIPESTGCIIDKTSRQTKDTESGNFVTYDCILNIPEALPDTITSITYSPFKISYDGIEMFDLPMSVKAWHLKYYNVDPIDSETSISDGVAAITFNVNAQRNVGEGDYPFEVRIEADSIYVQFEKISETRYKCEISNLQEGTNNLNIYVTEKGCPSSVFPFEIFYTKPVPKKETKENVVVRKKSPATKQTPPPPARLEI